MVCHFNPLSVLGDSADVAFPIQSEDALPTAGEKREQFDFDCKGDVDEKDTFELAKDVAAFANLAGGVVLVGAVEDKRVGILSRYLPMAAERAQVIADAFSKAVAQRCSPAPLVDVAVIPKDAGRVVAVNVWPFPSQAIGVRIPDAVTHKGPQKNRKRDAYVFPLRVGNDSIDIQPEQLAMLMLPQERRVTILLKAIPQALRKKVHVVGRHVARQTGHRSNFAIDLEFVDVRPLENVALFRSASQPDHPAHVPLNHIDSVWLGAHNQWWVLVQGEVKVKNGFATYEPPVWQDAET